MGFWTNKRVMVTGGAGFLGSYVVEALRERGCEPFIVRSRDFNLVDNSAVQRVYRDARPELVLHLAASVGGIGANAANPGRFFHENLMMGVQLMEEARRTQVSKFVALGTVCAYPKFCPVPFREEDLWLGYPEETNAPYGLAKKMLLVQAQAYRTQYGFNAIYLLPANLYGPRDHFDPQVSHVIPALIRRTLEAQASGASELVCWGDGTPTREFLHAHDAAEGILLAAERYDGSDPVNLGSGEEVSIAQLAQWVADACGFKGRIVWDKSEAEWAAAQKVGCVACGSAVRVSLSTFVRRRAARDGRVVPGPAGPDRWASGLTAQESSGSSTQHRDGGRTQLSLGKPDNLPVKPYPVLRRIALGLAIVPGGSGQSKSIAPVPTPKQSPVEVIAETTLVRRLADILVGGCLPPTPNTMRALLCDKMARDLGDEIDALHTDNAQLSPDDQRALEPQVSSAIQYGVKKQRDEVLAWDLFAMESLQQKDPLAIDRRVFVEQTLSALEIDMDAKEFLKDSGALTSLASRVFDVNHTLSAGTARVHIRYAAGAAGSDGKPLPGAFVLENSQKIELPNDDATFHWERQQDGNLRVEIDATPAPKPVPTHIA